ncbi:ABC transporter ATP-binding protein [Dickeya sp. CFBP 2040]|uniref:ABC transporter ATP-binding protein n=1 Tax=Dickeya poaceiphila TaxID=568768 RepID=A0A5B8I3W4_9GAMM|nr:MULTISPECIES: ABC transporter ATP-binding protein [Dickeya]NKI75622.1 ABC transporter ATP-binding protein [Dickeya sp. CFBP 2040]QDX29354.1 ABC transporter ATP-binding protein [Dickeya poaceiphila]
MLTFIFKKFESCIDPFNVKNNIFDQKNVLKVLITLAGKFKLLAFYLFMLGLLCSGCEVFIIHSSGKLVDMISEAGISRAFVAESLKENYAFICIFVSVLFVLRPILRSVNLLTINQSVYSRLSALVRFQLYNETLKNKMVFFDENNPGKITSSIWQAGQAVNEMASLFFQNIWITIAFFIFSFSVMASINLYLFVPILIWMIASFFVAKIYVPRTKKLARESANEAVNVNGTMSDNFNNILTIKLFSGSDVKHKFNRTEMSLKIFIMKSAFYLRAITSAESIMILVSSFIIGSITLLILYLWVSNGISSGEVAVVYSLIFKLEGLFTTLMDQFTALFRAYALFSNSVSTLLNNDKESEGKITFNMIETIEFKNISMKYGDKLVLKNLSFKIKAGEKVGVVGATGCGKSTIFKLLLGLYDYEESGEVLINTYKIKDIDLSCLRKNISYVSQDANFFDETLEYNIKIANNNLGKSDIENIFKKVCLEELFDESTRFHSLLNTKVGNKGATLSGGQLQRLNVARGLIKEHNVLLLDEMTSSLDPNTRFRMMANIRQCFKNKTVVCISHQHDILLEMDRVIFIKNGRVMAEGNHHDLLLSCNDYAQHWESETMKVEQS